MNEDDVELHVARSFYKKTPLLPLRKGCKRMPTDFRSRRHRDVKQHLFCRPRYTRDLPNQPPIETGQPLATNDEKETSGKPLLSKVIKCLQRQTTVGGCDHVYHHRAAPNHRDPPTRTLDDLHAVTAGKRLFQQRSLKLNPKRGLSQLHAHFEARLCILF